MTRILLDRSTNQLLPYPRQDNEPVAGLDRDAAYVVEVIREPEPEEYDPTTHYLQPLEPVVSITDPDGDDCNGTATYGWELVAITEPEPVPDWGRFKRIALGSDTLKSIAIAAYPTEPIAAGALSASLYEAEKGNIADFAGAWKLVCVAANVTPEVVTGFVGVAQACSLPADFVSALSPE